MVKHFLKKFSLFYKKSIVEIEEKALDILLNYNWPGNVRELENAIEYGFVRTNNTNKIELTKLPHNIIQTVTNALSNIPSTDSSEDFVKKENLLSSLNRNKWNKSKVAKELNIGRSTLWRKMNQFGIQNK